VGQKGAHRNKLHNTVPVQLSLWSIDRRGACSKRNPEIFGLQDCKNDEYFKHKENEVLKPFNKMLIMLCFDYEKLF